MSFSSFFFKHRDASMKESLVALSFSLCVSFASGTEFVGCVVY